jgi:hypothetical protein
VATRADPARLVVLGLSLIGLALAGAWFLRNFERGTYEIEEHASAAARRNPFLAAELFLRRLGNQVTAMPGRDPLRDLPPAGDILVVKGLGPLNPDRQEALLAWVEAGGDLIVVGPGISDPEEPHPDDLLAGLGIHLLEAEDAPRTSDGHVLIDVTFEGEREPLRLNAPAGLYLIDSEGRAQAATAGADGRYRLLQLRLGAGHITVSADDRFLTNGGIGEHDHAALLAHLATPADGSRVWLLYASDMPGLPEVLWRVAPYALGSGALLVGAFLWRLGWRLGPLEPPPGRVRRDLLEHLEAGADFLWRSGRASHLIAAARGCTERAWLRRHPPLRGLSREDRAAWIATRLGLPKGDVWRVLYAVPRDDAALVADADLLQRIWAGLAAGPGRPR